MILVYPGYTTKPFPVSTVLSSEFTVTLVVGCSGTTITFMGVLFRTVKFHLFLVASTTLSGDETRRIRSCRELVSLY